MEWRQSTLLHLAFCTTFIISGLLINIVQFLLFITLAPINREAFRSINYYLVYSIYAQLLFLADWWSKCKLNIYCAPELLDVLDRGLGGEHAVIIMNHHYEMDWLYGWMVADRTGLLGNARVYVKKMIQYVPVIGWSWAMSDAVFLERNWETDKKNLAFRLNQLLDFPSPMWLLIFAEGTRFSEEKHKASQEFAISRGLPVLKHHLIPRAKGFTFTVSQLDQARIKTVYDVTLVAGQAHTGQGANPTLEDALNGRSSHANMYIRKFQLENIPKDEEGATEWLMNLYKEKDELKESFIKTGSFSELSGQADYPCTNLPPRIYSLLISLSINLLILVPLAWFALSGGVYRLLGASMLLGLAYLAMSKLIGLTKISKGSSYGSAKKKD